MRASTSPPPLYSPPPMPVVEYEYTITDDCTGCQVKIVGRCLNDVFDWMRKNCWPTEGSCLIEWNSEYGTHSYR